MFSRCSAGLLILFFIASSARFWAQTPTPCSPAALISPEQPAYSDATALEKQLESQGIRVQCIFETKFSSQFLIWENGVPHSTLEGEACIRTNLGDLGVLFVARPKTFLNLKISERHTAGGYSYQVSGMSDVWPRKISHWSSVHRNYFFVHDNYLLTADTEVMRAAVEAALHYPPLSL